MSDIEAPSILLPLIRAGFVFSAAVAQNAFMSRFFQTRLLLLIGLSLSCLHCQTGANPNSPVKPENAPVPKYGYQVVNILPHDPNAFTQGLVVSDGKFLESTGEVGRSS